MGRWLPAPVTSLWTAAGNPARCAATRPPRGRDPKPLPDGAVEDARCALSRCWCAGSRQGLAVVMRAKRVGAVHN